MYKDLNGVKWSYATRVPGRIDLPIGAMRAYLKMTIGPSWVPGCATRLTDWSYHESAGGYTFFFDDAENMENFKLFVNQFLPNKDTSTMFRDQMGKEWEFSTTINKDGVDSLDALITFCTKYFGASYSWKILHNGYTFYFHKQHHMNAFLDFTGNYEKKPSMPTPVSSQESTTSVAQPRTPDGKFAPKKAAAPVVTQPQAVSQAYNHPVPVAYKPLSPEDIQSMYGITSSGKPMVKAPHTPSISIFYNGGRTSVSFVALSEDKVRELSKSLVDLCYAAEKEAVENQIPMWTYEQFSEIFLNEFEAYLESSDYHNLDHLENYLDNSGEDDVEESRVDDWLRCIITEKFVQSSGPYDIALISTLTEFLNGYDWYL